MDLTNQDATNFGIITFNKGLEDYFYYKRGIILRKGQPLEELFPNEELVNMWKNYYRVALLKGNYTTEYGTVAGEMILLLNFNILKKDSKIFGISVFGRNITDRKKTEKEVEAYKNNLEIMVETRTRQLEAMNNSMQKAKEDAELQIRQKAFFLQI